VVTTECKVRSERLLDSRKRTLIAETAVLLEACLTSCVDLARAPQFLSPVSVRVEGSFGTRGKNFIR